jgi:hypothetical protein
VALIPLISAWTLTRWPFANHRFPRKHFFYVRWLVYAFLIAQPVTLIFAPAFFFDVMFFFFFGYSLTSWMALTPSEQAEYRKAVQTAREAAKSAP